jgi:hypothetical protein
MRDLNNFRKEYELAGYADFDFAYGGDSLVCVAEMRDRFILLVEEENGEGFTVGFFLKSTVSGAGDFAQNTYNFRDLTAARKLFVHELWSRM